MSSTDSQSERPTFQDPTAYLRSATFSRGEGSPDPVTASDLLTGAYDPAKLHPLADLGDKLDYLLLDDDKTTDLPGAGTAIPSRGWSDDLCYGTGTMYLSGTWRSLLFTKLYSIPSPFGLHFFPGRTLSHLISLFMQLSLILLLFFSRHMLTAFPRFGHRWCLGRTRRCPKTSSRIQFEVADQQYPQLCHKARDFHR